MSALNTEQRTQVARWVADGATLSQVQERLRADFGLSLTYMDVRFLVDDLDLTLVDKPEPKPAEPAVAEAAAGEPTPPVAPAEAAAPGTAGKGKVTVDAIAHPGFQITGQVTFSDGQTAIWYVDMEGRPGLRPSTPGYRPTSADIQEFQILLDAEFRKMGY